MDESGDEFGARVTAIGALADPVRRRLYDYVVSCDAAVGREEAAAAAGVPLHSARFHLDRLVEEGLLDVEFRRLSGRSGPGAGRPAKLYRRGAREVAVSLPGRSYDLVGGVLAAAVDRSLAGEPLSGALGEEAREAGRRAAATYDGPPDAAELDRTAAVLADEGFEPSREQDDLVLRNCPFDSLARRHPELVCGINLDYVGGVLEGLGCGHAHPCLDPAPDRCCVRVRA
ncbi:MAG TPA: helix-turn-helix domain-containing protein [Marmoricola sp.]|nr:helix-turn-helix domain-containing protein [Marmoricola sp.]